MKRFIPILLGSWVGLCGAEELHTINLEPEGCERCEIYTLFSPYDNVEKAIIEELQEAAVSVHCSLFGITNRRLSAELARVDQTGVQVQIGLDKRQSGSKYDRNHALREAGVEVAIKKGSRLQHGKFCVIDGVTVIEGSWNWSYAAQTQDNSTVIFRNCPQQAKKFEAAFSRIWKRDTAQVKSPSK